MYRNLLLGTAAIALAAAASPANAQAVPGDVEIEGPLSNPVLSGGTGPNGQPYVGSINVLGVNVRVLDGALIHTPTNGDLGAGGANAGTLRGLQRLVSGQPLPGRSGAAQRGFLGGTAIVVGFSVGGQVYANDVFSDLFEHVVVGEATAPVADDDGTTLRATVNGMRIVPIDDNRMPAGPAINGLGLEIDSTRITAGSLVAAEGYHVPSSNILYYHTLEADDAPLANPNAPQVGILRADCRIRGGGRDEIEVRGGVANPPGAVVSISIPTLARPNRFTSIGVVQATPDPTASSPNQGIFRADFRTLNIADGICPTRVRASINGGDAFVTADMEGR